MSDAKAALVVPMEMQDILDLDDWFTEHKIVDQSERDKIIRNRIMDLVYS